ncbi:MAG: BON domain-containing protein [Bryobacteraceae bacterium]|nr:BON domain-containing protein [Bryobacteraceae bacterium]
MKNAIRNFALTLAAAVVLAPFAQGAVSVAQSKKGLTGLEKEIRHELVMLPYFGVFDNLEFQVNGDEVVLLGQVTRPTLRSDAERLVKRIEGVERVVNQIEVLPLSPFDDRIRLATYRSLYSFGPLSRYNQGPVPPIHIIVKNGNVTLKGFVANDTDRNLANIRANQVSSVFSVTNDLKVDKNS